MENITKIIKKLNIQEYELYGNFMAKINDKIKLNPENKLILVTSISPTSSGEGKTTTAIGLTDSLNKLGYLAIAALREPSMGPVFGKKGGAVGAGLAKMVPEDKINFHFTGDFHAITYANNLISAVIDNHIYQGNTLGFDSVVFKRCLDINDRSLRNVLINNEATSFIITPASEIMSILGVSETLEELKENLNNIIVGYTKDMKSIKVSDLKLVDALLLVLKDAFKPNLVQTLYGNPVIVHTGPFANISYGASSIKSIKLASRLSDYTITEAGFGSDTGALKFFDIICRKAKFTPHAVILNVTIKALKHHGNGDLKKGLENLEYHIENMTKFTSNLIVSLNKFSNDTESDIKILKDYLTTKNIKLCISTMYTDGDKGCLELAKYIIDLPSQTKNYQIYSLEDTLLTKINKMKTIFGAKEITMSKEVKEKIAYFEKYYPNLPICICKTPYSISDNKELICYPKDFNMKITDISIYNGARYIVLYMGNVLLMPGLAKESNYLNMHYKDNQK